MLCDKLHRLARDIEAVDLPSFDNKDTYNDLMNAQKDLDRMDTLYDGMYKLSVAFHFLLDTPQEALSPQEQTKLMREWDAVRDDYFAFRRKAEQEVGKILKKLYPIFHERV